MMTAREWLSKQPFLNGTWADVFKEGMGDGIVSLLESYAAHKLSESARKLLHLTLANEQLIEQRTKLEQELCHAIFCMNRGCKRCNNAMVALQPPSQSQTPEGK